MPPANALGSALIAAFFPQVSTLGAYMDALVEGGRCELDGDRSEYKRLLRTTMVGHGPVGARLAFYEPAERLSDTVLKVIGSMLKRDSLAGGSAAGRQHRNMLTLGYELRRDGGMNCVGGDSSVVNHFVNSSVMELGGRWWAQLLARTGTEAMAHLLHHTSMFLPLPNGGYCQISGVPLAAMPMPPSAPIQAAAARLFRLSAASGAKRKRDDADAGAGRARRARRAAGPEDREPPDGTMEPPLALAAISIGRGRMLFSAPLLHGALRWSLPAGFPLNRCASPDALVQQIFGRTRQFAAAPPGKLVVLAGRLLRLHRRFNYQRHLFRLCPAPWQQGPLKQACPYQSVFMFLQHCIRSVVPRDLIGGKRNHRRLYAALRTVVSAGRFEDVTLHQATQRVRLGEAAAWLDTRHPQAMDIYAGLVHWVLGEYAVQLVRAYFYVTESSLSRHRLFYFRNDVWRRLHRGAWQQLKEAGMYEGRAAAEARAAAAAGDARQELGHSRMRLLPKEQGFRTIVNMRRSYVVRAAAERPVVSTNKRLGDVLAALRPWQQSRPELFGMAAFGLDDVHARLAAFKRGLREAVAGGLYMAKLDIARAYDTIPQAQLLAWLRARLPDEEMAVHKYWLVEPALGRPRAAFVRHGQAASEPTEFRRLARGVAARRCGVVVGDQSATAYVHADAIHALVAEHVQQNTVRLQSAMLRQRRGIPQGSVLSSLLCNFFYGQLEAEHVAPAVDPRTTLVVRVVDDILVVSTARAHVAAVVDRVRGALARHGCALNAAKTLANFALTVGALPARRAASHAFPWCGMLIDDRSLDVMADYSRLAPPAQPAALAASPAREPGRALRSRMLAVVRAKIRPLYVSCRHNARATVLLNLYQNFVVCAKKLHAACCRLDACARNPRFVVSIIEDVLATTYVLLRSSCRERSIAPDVVRWLGAHAFRAVLARKQARYAAVLACLAAAARNMPAAARADAWVVGSSRNATVHSIVY
ncbi:hypothetical protein H4R18_003571 [Coemansia javaensis]|uniref:Telomerase reverse transcriptase n=1 Tax=Coemansia javaensis TaxID=2761396 RepID=A0A9W8H8A8_9FUNG|nr:hypothetical protein H4R18_003571 [Coemansia javaensis]